MSSGKYYPTAVGNPVDGSDGSAVPTAVGHIVDMPTNSVPTFEVRLPFNAGPGVQFGFQVDGRMHSMIIPEGAQPNQTLRCMLVPMGAPPGTDVIVTTPDGDMAVTIPEGMRTGEVLVVDMGDSLRQWVTPEEGCCAKLFRCWSPVCEAIIKVIRCALPFCVCLLLLTMLAAMAGLFRPRHPYGYGGGYGGYGYSQPISSYNQHVLDHSHVVYGASPPAPPIDANMSASFPGSDEGFERGVDESGSEIYRYEYQNQVYVIPGNDYYAWRSEHYHGHMSHAILEMLLFSAMFHALAYPRGIYYGGGHYFGAPRGAYYHSAGYQSHYGNPVRGANGAVTYPRATGPAGGVARTGTPVAAARPVSPVSTQHGVGSTLAAQWPGDDWLSTCWNQS